MKNELRFDIRLVIFTDAGAGLDLTTPMHWSSAELCSTLIDLISCCFEAQPCSVPESDFVQIQP
jgi:hypothetical protein